MKDPSLKDTAVIVNEFGEIGLDHLFIETPEDETVLLNNGCLCCTILGDLGVTLASLMAKRLDGTVPTFARVIVETTGIADPTPILETLVSDDVINEHYEPGGIVTVVDAVHGLEQLEKQFEARRQVALADRLMISKVDLSYPEEIDALSSRLSAINPAASVNLLHEEATNLAEQILSVTATAGRIGPQAGRDHLVGHLGEKDREGGHGHIHNHGSDQDVETFSVVRESELSREGLNVWLHNVAAFGGQKILRIKGIINVSGRPVSINVIQALVHDPIELECWPDDNRQTRLVFITHGLTRDDLEHLVASLDYKPWIRPEQDKSIDPKEFQRFVGMISPFRKPDQIDKQ